LIEKEEKMRKLFRGLFVVNFLIDFSLGFFGSFHAESDAFFLLRIRNRSFNDSESLIFEAKEEIANSAFDKEKSVIFQVHGYLENKDIKQHLALSE
jgi:hypothetical protein